MNTLILGIMCVANFISLVQSEVSSLDNIKDSIVYKLSDGSVIVAVIAEPIFTLSTRLKIYEDIEEIMSKNGVIGDVFISFDIDIFSKLSSIDSEEQAKEVIETIKSRQRN